MVGLSIKLPTRRSAFDTSSYIIMLKHLLKNIWPPLVGIWNQDPKQFCIKNSQITEQLATQISWMEEILHSSDLIWPLCAGKSFSEVLTLGSANSQYDKRLSIDLPVQYLTIPNLEHGKNMGRTWGEHVAYKSCS